MKKTLSFLLWPEPPAPVINFNHLGGLHKRLFIFIVSRILKLWGYEVAYQNNFSLDDRISGRIWPGYADTMIGLKRLDNLQFCVETVIEENIEGDLIETGVWRGGACIFMRAVLAAHEIKNRKVFVADSFQGLPHPDAGKYNADKGDEHYIHEYLAVSKEEVEANFKKYGLLDDQVIFLKGWFKDTLPAAPIEKLSVLRLDGDMYGSTIEALDNLYPKLSKGGFCIIDDYALMGCKKAVDDYRRKYGIGNKIEQIDQTGIFWRR